MKAILSFAVAGAVFLALTGIPRAQAPVSADKVRITGWALSMSTVAPGTNQTIQITINRWSTAAQRDRLIQVFLDKKQDGLVRALEDEAELGRFDFRGYRGSEPDKTIDGDSKTAAAAGSDPARPMRAADWPPADRRDASGGPPAWPLGIDIRYAMNHPGEEGGRRIIIITPRVIGLAESVSRPRTVDYPFTMFEMRFDRNGKGEGRMAVATQIIFDKNKKVIELEDYSSEPVLLNELKLEVVK